MTQNIPLNSGDVAIEPFFDATQELLGAASPSFRVFIQSATVLRVTADSGNDQQSIAINGRYRFRTTPVDATHPGGGAGTHAVYVTASNNSFTLGGSTTDNTVYAFGLEIKTSGTPTAVDQYRKVADVDWDGAQITALRQFVGGRFDGDPGVFVAPLATITPLQVKAASSQSADVAKIVSSSDSVLFRISSSGAATFADAVSLPNAGLTVGDTNLYRSAADVLKTDDAFHAIEGFSAPGMTASTSEALKASVFGDTQNRLSVQASGEMTWGSGTAAGDTNLYRSAANTLRTDDALYVSGGITVPGGITGLANNAVDTAHITNGSVTSEKILDGTITNAKLATPPPRRLAYITRTSTYAVSSSTISGAADLFSSDLSITADGTSDYRFEFFCPLVWVESVSNGGVFLALVRGDGTEIGEFGSRGRQDGVAVGHNNIRATIYSTPASGARTFNVRARFQTASSNPQLINIPGIPMFLAIFGADAL